MRRADDVVAERFILLVACKENVVKIKHVSDNSRTPLLSENTQLFIVVFLRRPAQVVAFHQRLGGALDFIGRYVFGGDRRCFSREFRGEHGLQCSEELACRVAVTLL